MSIEDELCEIKNTIKFTCTTTVDTTDLYLGIDYEHHNLTVDEELWLALTREEIQDSNNCTWKYSVEDDRVLIISPENEWTVYTKKHILSSFLQSDECDESTNIEPWHVRRFIDWDFLTSKMSRSIQDSIDEQIVNDLMKISSEQEQKKIFDKE
jgi:hypothetical protein